MWGLFIWARWFINIIKRVISCIFFPEIVSELIEIAGRKVEINIDFKTFFLSKTNFFSHGLSFGFGSTIMLDFHM